VAAKTIPTPPGVAKVQRKIDRNSQQKQREFASPSRTFRADFVACFRPIGFELPRPRKRRLQASSRRLGTVGNQTRSRP
jgi:hypothetical protein